MRKGNIMSPDEIEKLKQQILLEERLRQEVKDSLSSPIKPSFFNSNLGLWLLSAIFISGLGTYYNHWNQGQIKETIKLEQTLKKEDKNQEVIEKLDTEIGYRISKSLTSFNGISHYIKFDKYSKDKYKTPYDFAVEQSFQVLKQMASYPPKTFPPLYPEYKDSSLPMLISELHRKVKSENKSELQSVLSTLLDVSSHYEFKGEKGKSPQEITAKLINENFLLERWKSQPFRYLNCKESEPLC